MGSRRPLRSRGRWPACYAPPWRVRLSAPPLAAGFRRPRPVPSSAGSCRRAYRSAPDAPPARQEHPQAQSGRRSSRRRNRRRHPLSSTHRPYRRHRRTRRRRRPCPVVPFPVVPFPSYLPRNARPEHLVQVSGSSRMVVPVSNSTPEQRAHDQQRRGDPCRHPIRQRTADHEADESASVLTTRRIRWCTAPQVPQPENGAIRPLPHRIRRGRVSGLDLGSASEKRR